MHSSILFKSVPRVGSRALRATTGPVPRSIRVSGQHRSTSWMGFEQPNPSAYNTPVLPPTPPSPSPSPSPYDEDDDEDMMPPPSRQFGTGAAAIPPSGDPPNKK
ncbi:hypothetical protein PG994_003965 [Apiospora phragmitis]|uniref:Uncharacterized protein n=1 Tax=Apiospora phragmitis TaxID=2905665 RepID=A0ABR1VZQ7_9PEZI